MFKVITTKTLDHADQIEANSIEFDNRDDAIAAFDTKLKQLVNDAFNNNEFLHIEISVHNYKALVKIEGTHYCIAIVS